MLCHNFNKLLIGIIYTNLYKIISIQLDGFLETEYICVTNAHIKIYRLLSVPKFLMYPFSHHPPQSNLYYNFYYYRALLLFFLIQNLLLKLQKLYYNKSNMALRGKLIQSFLQACLPEQISLSVWCKSFHTFSLVSNINIVVFCLLFLKDHTTHNIQRPSFQANAYRFNSLFNRSHWSLELIEHNLFNHLLIDFHVVSTSLPLWTTYQKILLY